MSSKPVVLFICQHNAGRSQLGAALLDHIAGDRYTATSAGVSPDESINPAVAASLAELGIDTTGNKPRAVTATDIRTADIVVTMKPGLQLPASPTGLLAEWQFPDPSDWDSDGVRPLREAIASNIHLLLHELDKKSDDS